MSIEDWLWVRIIAGLVGCAVIIGFMLYEAMTAPTPELAVHLYLGSIAITLLILARVVK